LEQNKALFPDGFGIFPLELRQNKFNQLLGYKNLVIEADFLRVESKGKATDYDYSSIETLELDASKILLYLKDQKNAVQLKLNGDTKAIFDVINRVWNEWNLFTEFIAKNTTEDRLMEFLPKCLMFRAEPYVWAVRTLLKMSKDCGVSDFHFEPLEDVFQISFRINDEISQSCKISKKDGKRVIARLKHLAGCKSHIANKPQEGAFKDKETGLDIRFSVFPSDNGERVSVRLINAIRFSSLEELGWCKNSLEAWKNTINHASGLFLICGPVGSGKTTALYATLSELRQQATKSRIVTIEDPVEAKIDGICQSSLDFDADMTLAQGFKYLLRQDPDVIALGEIRDKDCVREALQAGLSGHLVFATFHAGSAQEAILRIKQMVAEDSLILDGIKGILSLKLSREGRKAIPEVNIEKMAGIEQ
jgi:general secretion pathway protein E